MLNYRILIALTENDKRMIFALLLVVLLVLALIGYLSYLLIKLMKWQSKKIDTLIHDVVVTKVITDKKHLLKFGKKKNAALFFKQSLIPVNIILFGLIIWIIKCALDHDFTYNAFNTYDGFGTIFWTWKFSGEYIGGNIIRFAELVVDNTPHMVKEAWASYICCPCFIVGLTWYLVTVCAFTARSIKLVKRSKELFEKSLDNFNQGNNIQTTE